MMKNDFISQYIRPLAPIPTPLNPAGKLEEKIQCILFDLYGTLFISSSGDIGLAKQESQKFEDLRNLLDKYGINDPPEAILKRLFATIDSEHKMRKENGADFPEVEIDRIWMRILDCSALEIARAFSIEFELILNPVYPMPNLERMLSACKNLNVIMGIISNAQFYTPVLFNWFLGSRPENLGFHPDLILYSYKFGYAKPSLFMFQIASKKLGDMSISTRSTLYMGNDMLNDIYPAKKMGFQTALFAGDARSLRTRKNDPKCQDLSADIIITDLLQLLDHIQIPETRNP